MIFLLLLLATIQATSPLLEPLTQYTVPESIDGHWLQRPHSLITDEKGRLFISDQDARVVFVWDRTGNPLGVWGRSGHGPGEFQGPTFLDFAGEELHVLDPTSQRIEVFDTTGKAIRTVTLRGIFTPPMGFLARHQGGYFLVLHSVLEEKPSMRTVLLDAEGNIKKVVHAFPDESFVLKESTTFSMLLTAYAGETTLFRYGKGYAVACGYAPEIQLFDAMGNRNGSIELSGLQTRPVLERDREEFLEMEIPWMDGSFKALKHLKNYIQVDFPKYMPYFTGIKAMDSGHFLVYELSKSSHVLSGRLFSEHGRRVSLGRKSDFQMTLGWQGTFHLSGDLLYTLRFLDQTESFQIDTFRWRHSGGG